MNMESAYETYRKLLFSIAYRLLGSRTEAEDAVQDVFVSLHSVDPDSIDNLKAFLSRSVANRCLNSLKSAKKRKELYPGPWLPEPLYAGTEAEPGYRLELAEEIRYAYLVMLELLSPMERAVFVLRGAFDFEYAEIAGIIGKTEDNCRKILSRARRKITEAGYDAVSSGETERSNVGPFIEAMRQGNIATAIGLLADSVVLMTDGGGKVRSAMRPLAGIERVGAFLAGIARKRAFADGVDPVTVNGETGMRVRRTFMPDAIWSFSFDPQTGLITRIYAVSNPDKLIGE
ncbi:RNA polymerase sigma factor SigJ [Paenibacillus hodogayensis]|uniref:RNA polymerase sigma factor SigJ n=1 Tax=Paenibacillus hodogayensis TaxID=279208 RepID=A0ABV5VS29_9BACL